MLSNWCRCHKWLCFALVSCILWDPRASRGPRCALVCPCYPVSDIAKGETEQISVLFFHCLLLLLLSPRSLQDKQVPLCEDRIHKVQPCNTLNLSSWGLYVLLHSCYFSTKNSTLSTFPNQHSLSGQWQLLLGEIRLCESRWDLHMGQPCSWDSAPNPTKHNTQQLAPPRSQPHFGLQRFHCLQLDSKPEPTPTSQSYRISVKHRSGQELLPKAVLGSGPAGANIGGTSCEDHLTVQT